jgi:cyanophycinase
MSIVLLAGGAEFGGAMAAADERALELAGGRDAPIVIIPAAAAPDNNHERAGARGVAWFERLGARQVQWLPVIDQQSANDARLAGIVERAALIYMLGGFPAYLAQVMHSSLVWRGMRGACVGGAIIAGSSAGAMVLGEYLVEPRTRKVTAGLGLLADMCFVPHLNTFGSKWWAPLRADVPASSLVGVDEQTALINDGAHGAWTVYGRGSAAVEDERGILRAAAGESIPAGRIRINMD